MYSIVLLFSRSKVAFNLKATKMSHVLCFYVLQSFFYLLQYCNILMCACAIYICSIHCICNLELQFVKCSVTSSSNLLLLSLVKQRVLS